MVTLLNKHIKIIRNLGLTAEPVIDSLRVHSQKIWQYWTIAEKKEFLKRFRHLWGVARHRLPLHIHDIIQDLRVRDKLVLYSGIIENITQNNSPITVDFYNRKTGQKERITVERVINCTGPENNIKNNANRFLYNLWKRGIIVPDMLELGIYADTDDFRIINSHGIKLSNVFTLGTNLKGMLWETVAVPELRQQADKLSEVILAQIGQNAKKFRRLPKLAAFK